MVCGALLAAAVITAVVWYYPWLPDPAHANRRELIRWLVTRNLEQVPEATREVLAQRLEEEFSGDIDWDATARELTDGQRQLLRENVRRLVGPWIRTKARSYASLSDVQQTAYLDQLIDTLQQWRGLDKLAPGSGTTGNAESRLLATAVEQLNALADHVDPADQEQTRAFVTALQIRWVAREFMRHLAEQP